VTVLPYRTTGFVGAPGPGVEETEATVRVDIVRLINGGVVGFKEFDMDVKFWMGVAVVIGNTTE